MIELRTLGSVSLCGPDGTELGSILERPKLLGLLAYLAAGEPRGYHRRDSLLLLFWAELDQERARGALRQSIFRLRQVLGDGVVVNRGEDELALDPDRFKSDVRSFDESLASGNLAKALELYRGEFLPGFFISNAPEFERWLEQRRSTLREQAATAAWKLAEKEIAGRNPTLAGGWGRRALELAPFDERLLQRTITLLDATGDRAGAVAVYEAFRRRILDEWELEPSPETRGLIEDIRLRSRAASGYAAPSPVAPPHAPTRGSPGKVDPSGSTTTPGSGTAPAPPVQASTESFAKLNAALRGRYVIQKKIGSGGMASVYLARDVRHERDVAVKVMHPELAAGSGAERFLREIKIAARLNHPHVVAVFDSGLAEGVLYFVMPLVAGESLQSRLGRGGIMSPAEALPIVVQVADALDYAHRSGVVHRDIKPANILLADKHAFVADFGVALAAAGAAEDKLTVHGVAVGTPSYMSPEQRDGRAEVDGRADVYSLGRVVQEMLTGTPSDRLSEKDDGGRQVPYRTPSVQLPRTTVAAIDKALAESPGDRFATAGEFATALQNASRGKPTTRPRGGTFRVRLPLLAAAMVLVAVTLVLLQSALQSDLDPNRVAVVPLINRTGDPTLTVIGDMAADWIAQGLQQIDVIEVIPTPLPERDGSTTGDDLRQLARSVEAGTLVAGAFYRNGDSIEFQTQLVNTATGQFLRAIDPVTGSSTAPGDGIAALQQRVAGTVARALDRRLVQSPPGVKPPTLGAYREYLEGFRAFMSGRMTDASLYFQRAKELDSSFMEPRFYLALTYANMGDRALADSTARLLVPHRTEFSSYMGHTLDWLLAGLRGDRMGALLAARARGSAPDIGFSALAANHPRETIETLSDLPDSPEFYYRRLDLMSALHMVGDHRRELREGRRVRREYPSRFSALISVVQALAALGRIEDVDRLLDESLLTPPENNQSPAAAMQVAAAELKAHGFEDVARRAADRAVDWFATRPRDEQESWAHRWWSAHAYYVAGQWEEANARFQTLATEQPQNPETQGYLGVIAARLDDRRTALAISERLEGAFDPYDFGRDLYWQACIAAQLGERDRAMVLLRESYARGRAFDLSLHRDMDLQPLWDYPPFQEFLEPQG